mgnify:CR=1 FL=1|jgi:hypothetical protein
MKTLVNEESVSLDEATQNLFQIIQDFKEGDIAREELSQIDVALEELGDVIERFRDGIADHLDNVEEYDQDE